MQFSTIYLNAAGLNTAYSTSLEVIGGVGPYSYALIGGSLPPGLTLNGAGLLSGTATQLGIFNFMVEATDSTLSSVTATFAFTVMAMVTLDDTTVDQAQFVQQFQQVLSNSQTWSTGLTTMTSQTLIDLISTIGNFNTARIVRAKEDAFPSSAQSDSAIRAIATMQGLRLSRKLPATVTATLTATEAQSLAPYTQFSAAGYSWFNTDQIVLSPGIPITVILKEGVVQNYSVSGLGTDLQAWVSTQDRFSVSDQDVKVSINSTQLNKTFGGLWNYASQTGFADLTLNDGRLLLQFGSKNYGSVPLVNDLVTIEYAVTQGATINSAVTNNTALTVPGNVTISGRVTSNPSGGADEKSPVAYKNFSSGTFGTYSSGVTKAQYGALVNNYPGIVDAVTQAQREINPGALQWMNVIRVSGLTNSPWSVQQKKDFLTYMQNITMYSGHFIWKDPTPLPRDVDISIFCFNSVNSTTAITALARSALQKLFSARPGVLMTNLYVDDIINTVRNAAPGQISYVIVNSPTSPMIVTAPPSPLLNYTVTPSGGSLTPKVYSYAISTDAPSPDGSGTIEVGSPTNWVFPQIVTSGSSIHLDWSGATVAGATAYHVWGRRAGYVGILATVGPSVTSYTDVGGADPVVIDPASVSDIYIRYNTLNSLNVVTDYADRQSNVGFPIRDVLS